MTHSVLLKKIIICVTRQDCKVERTKELHFHFIKNMSLKNVHGFELRDMNGAIFRVFTSYVSVRKPNIHNASLLFLVLVLVSRHFLFSVSIFCCFKS